MKWSEHITQWTAVHGHYRAVIVRDRFDNTFAWRVYLDVIGPHDGTVALGQSATIEQAKEKCIAAIQEREDKT